MKYFWLLSCVISLLHLSACGTDTTPGQTTSAAGPGEPVTNEVTITVGDVTHSDPESYVNDPLPPSLSLRLTDAPLTGVSRVQITVTAVELVHEEDERSLLFTFNQPKAIDLLSLQGVQTETLLSDIAVPAGTYSGIRLLVDDSARNSFIELDNGSIHNLRIPSGSSSGLKINEVIVLLESQMVSYTIDFDVVKSLVQAGASGNYLLKPVLRLIDNSTSGHIRGTVDPSLLIGPLCSDNDPMTHNAIYVFEGHGVTPADIDLSTERDTDPVTSAQIVMDSDSGEFVYEAAFLPAGDYTIALTCSADLEDPESEQDLLFFGIQNVTVRVNNILFL